ncbi:bifunctional Sec23-Sec24 helical domain superfamily/von Willebrand factor A-like domain superfamily/Protein transport protein Sec23/Sec23-Sec24 beta-sandwich/Gelsolin-like domain superfamily/Zinc finger [Babesia duncani]|uniref:Protein transport protein SEC23 n=1 Tax=Babesia duncani TaxID=323732 RepID=A0AAD9PIQ1_9APIC|nr:bifunctional Sec23-Sec24 helical domain superfamily/von Willebrand factor A-like domain superfamily/Protein transport protein Sec23/Sec23-Sec24 beta-sandwich/Gelsolin-like domain superfamily/Zinc finger [Babesia duncani]
MNDYTEFESHTGLRFSWNVWPCSHEEMEKAQVPIGCLFTPLKRAPESENGPKIPLVEYMPVRCRSSGIFLNPYCHIDFRAKTWTCPVTMQRNTLPPSYAEHITPENLPSELVNLSIEYIIPSNVSGGVFPPAIVFLVDTSIPEEELEQLKDSIQQVLSMLPPEVNVGLITYGSVIKIHDLSESEVPKCFVLRGSGEHTGDYLKRVLNLEQIPQSFIQPISACEFALNSFLDHLMPDSWPVGQNCRANRCTGSALSTATALLEICCPNKGGRVMLFTGGPCTFGPGKVVDTPLSESIRHHLDLQMDLPNARHVKEATEFYTRVATRCARNGHAIDLFACSLDQSGLYEMKVCCDKTGGYMVMSDSFSMSVFKDSLKVAFSLDENGHLKHGYNAKIEVFTSPELKVCGAVGGCTATEKQNSNVSSISIGEGNTSEWIIGALDDQSTLAFYFDVIDPATDSNSIITSALNTLGGGSSSQAKAKSANAGRLGFIQFQTIYLHSSGQKRLRVTSYSCKYAEPNLADLVNGFDQEAAAVLMARFAFFKSQTEDPTSVLRWLDKRLIHLVSKFADYQKNEAHTFRLAPEFAIYPQFMYHLRRSHFLQTFNASPDETAYYRTILTRENVINSLLMIQPALLEYSFDNPAPKPVLLDAVSLKNNVILMLDSFFYVIIWYGEQIHQWQELGYQDKTEYAHFKELLNAPAQDAKHIIGSRFPTPKFILCNQGGSQARFLLAKVNPSTTHNTSYGFADYTSADANGASVVNTDDVSLKTFMEHLVRLVVQS